MAKANPDKQSENQNTASKRENEKFVLRIKFIPISNQSVFTNDTSVFSKCKGYLMARMRYQDRFLDSGNNCWIRPHDLSKHIKESWYPEGNEKGRQMHVIFHDAKSSPNYKEISQELGVFASIQLETKFILISSEFPELAQELQNMNWPFFIFTTKECANEKIATDELAYARYLTVLQGQLVKDPYKPLIKCHEEALHIAYLDKPIGERPTLYTRPDIDDNNLCLANFI